MIDAARAPDAASDADAAPSDCPALEPGAGSGFEECNPLTQEGCADGEKCTWLETGITACAPDGTVAIGETCADTGDGDDCVAGGLCVDDRCKAICTTDSDSCCAGFACARYASTFTDDPAGDTGVCDSLCDPVAQDCAAPADACYLALVSGKATCSHPATGAEDLTQGETCANDGTFCYLNGCAESYGAFLYAGAGVPRNCAAFCSPVDTYLVDPDGSGTGELVAGADADGAAPTDCSEARIGVTGHQCRFFQSYFVDQNNDYLDYVPAEYGFCVPRGETFGNCNRFSEEWFFESYNDFIEGGGTPDGWGNHLVSLCNERPARCTSGCTSIATREALDAAYCAVSANMNRPACIDGGAGARAVRRSLERYWAAQRIRAGAITD